MPVNINLLSDDTIARGITPPDIGNFGTALTGTQDYFQQQALRNLFANGLPRDPNDPKLFDYPKIAEMLARVQGGAAIPTLAALRQADIQQQALRQNTELGNPFPPLPDQPRVQFPGSTGRPPGQAPSQYQSSAEPDQGGGEQGGGRRLRADQPGNIDGEVIAQTNDGQPTEVPGLRSFAQVASTDSRYPDFGTPSTERFTPPQAPPTEAPVQVAQATTRPQPPANAPARPPIENPNDPGYWTLENARAYDRAAYIFNMRAQNLGVSGLKGESGPAQQAKQLGDRANQIYEHISKATEPTQAMKDAAASGFGSPYQFERGKKVQEAELVRGDATYKGLASQSNQYEQDLKPYLQQAKAIINDPSMYSGFGSEASLNWNKIRSNFGDKQAALLQEALQKITAQSVLGTLNLQRDQMQQTGAQSGRIFSQQVDQVNKAVAGLPTTLPGNRYLVEMQMRLGEHSSKIYDLARDYVDKHGAIDAGFDKIMSAWLRKPENQPFTKDELSYPQLMGAPSVPPAMANNPAAIVQWGQALGVKPGEAIRFPNGKVQGFTLTPRVQ